MNSNIKFTYTTNLGGNVPFLITNQRATLSDQNLNFKVTGESIFINLNEDKMSELVRSVLHEIKSKRTEDKTFSGSESWSVLRTDIESESVVYTLGSNELPLLMFSFFSEDNSDYDEAASPKNVSEVNVFTVGLSGEESLVDQAFELFENRKVKLVKSHKNALVRWYVPTSHGGLKDFNFQIKKDWVVEQSHYPWVKTDLQKYYQAFAESRAQIIVLYGKPGTGKTTFIRDMICELNMNSIISYDLKVITSDMTFVKYLSDKNFDAIIIEDADELLTAERGEYNKIISKILNVSDGLIKLPKKKLILTTNLEKLHDLDPAIIRPGRCFDVMEFRPFTKPEYTVIADELGMVLSEEDNKKKTMTLAEVFSLREQRSNGDPLTTNHKIKTNSIGFV